MKQFIIKDYYREFIEHCDTQLKSLLALLHYDFNDMHNTIESLNKDYYDYLNKYHIDLNRIYNLTVIGRPLLYTKSETEDLFISLYNYLLIKINNCTKTTKDINKFTFYKSIPISIYKTILFNCNFEHSISLLKGNIVDLPKIGDLTIVRILYDSSKPDWGASYKFKEELERLGHTTKDDDNPTGKSWVVDNGLNRNDFTILKWYKSYSKLKNKKQYRFNASVYGNFYPKSLDRPYSIDEIINKTGTGLYDKISHIYRFHYQYTQNNYPFHQFTKTLK